MGARVLQSTAVLLLLFLLAANLLFARVDAPALVPMEQMNPQEAAERALTYKVRSLQRQRDVDVLLLGSSLPMAAAYYADAEHRKSDLDSFVALAEREKLNPFQAYPNAKHLEDMLSKASGSPVRVANLTAPACMISDAFLVLDESVHTKKPQTVIWGIAPRDFVDNVIPPIGKTPAFTALHRAEHLPSVLSSSQTPVSNADLVLASTVNFYNQRRSLKHAFDLWTSQVFNHPINLTDRGLCRDGGLRRGGAPAPPVLAENGRPVVAGPKAGTVAAGAPPLQAPETAAAVALPLRAPIPEVTSEKRERQLKGVAELPECRQKPVLHALALDPTANEPGWNHSLVAQYVDYWHRYNPPNFARLDAQLAQFEHALQLCKRSNINIVLVQMPLPTRHQTLIDPKLYAAYKSRVAAAATKYGAKLIDLNTPDSYNTFDWIDSLHVTASGADKFLNALISNISSDHALCANIAHPRSIAAK